MASKRSPARSNTHTAALRGPTFAVLADEWLHERRTVESADQQRKGHSDRARRSDLGRWARLFRSLGGDDVDWSTDLDLASEGDVTAIGVLTEEQLLACLGAARQRWADATVRRMVSTLRSFTSWALRRGHLSTDPCADRSFRISAHTTRRPKGLTSDEIDALRAAAAADAPPASRRFTPVRDVAIVEMLAGTGIRASELCALRANEIDWTTERPVLRIDAAKGGRSRDVPLPSAAVAALRPWLAELAQMHATSPQLLGNRPLFVQNSGRQATTGWLDQLVRSLCARAGVQLPDGAAAHAFRHAYGLRAAFRGVPNNALSQLLGHADPKTTAIYTTASSRTLIAALDDAGLL